MQKLKFESSWDKTLSDKDRKRINQVFLGSNLSKEDSIQLTPLWQARNYKGELLVTVLVHNFGTQVLSFRDKNLCYVENNEVVAKHKFPLSNLIIEPKTSMPWTFIFPVESLCNEPGDKGSVLLSQ
ncbi:SLAP domain-containing protein [Heyndrickxia sp. NPDC080065]|uniref:SLAP domain-containing protein n=1 Tax=Heyndrickxia sp. NPDC080065 TaxID=3390568 RepID=UPI003D010289